MTVLGQGGGDLLRVDCRVDLRELDTAPSTTSFTGCILHSLVRRDLR